MFEIFNLKHFIITVCGDAEQHGEVNQIAAANHAGHLPLEERRRDLEEKQGNGRVPDHPPNLQTLARRENISVKKVISDREK